MAVVDVEQAAELFRNLLEKAEVIYVNPAITHPCFLGNSGTWHHFLIAKYMLLFISKAMYQKI